MVGKECTVKDVEAFLAEAIVMKDCHNDNVLSLLGVVIAGNRPFAILPYMEHGDLKSYIAAPERVGLCSVNRINCHINMLFILDA